MIAEFDFTSYKHLVDFLGACLGEYTEVVLYSFDDINKSVIALCNGHIGGTEIGDPLTGFAISKLKDKGKEGPPYYLNYLSMSRNHTPLRSSSFFILDKHGKPRGLISINTDATKYQLAADILQKLAFLPGMEYEKSESTDLFQSSPRDVIIGIMNDVTNSIGVSSDRLTVDEKVEIVRRLNIEGFFLMKGAVSQIALILGTSEATIYRYLSSINKQLRREKEMV